MDCPKCGGRMKKGCIAFPSWSRFRRKYHIKWYFEKSIKEYSELSNNLLSFFVTPDLKFRAKRYKMGRYGLDSYLCEKCGTITVMPLPEDAKNIEYYIENSDTEV